VKSPDTVAIAASILTAALAACTATQHPDADSSAQTKKPFVVAQPFPTPAELEAIAAKPAPQGPADPVETAKVSSWTMTGTPPTSTAPIPYAGDEPHARAFAELVRKSGKGRRETAPMACVASELATFLASGTEGTLPADVQGFIVSRCGGTSDAIGWGTYKIPDAKKARPYEAEILQDILGHVPEGAHVGAGFALAGDEGVFVVAYGAPELVIDDFEMAQGKTGSVRVQGTSRGDTEWVSAMITQGELGAKLCRRVFEGLEKREVAFECPTRPDDPAARIEILAAPPGALLGHQVAALFLSPDGSLPTTYTVRADALPVDDTDFSSASIVAAVNKLRERAKLRPLESSEAQNQVLENLFDHLLGAESEDLRNKITLGLMAGYRVDGVIADASLQAFAQTRSASVEDTLARSLASPAFRRTFLDPESDVLCTAVRDVPDRQARRFLAVSYALFDRTDFSREEAAFLDALDAQRAEVGLAPVIRVQGPSDVRVLTESTDRMRTGETSPTDELNFLVNHFSKATNRDFYGQAYTPLHIEGWTPSFRDELFANPYIAVATRIGYFKPTGAAWGQHVVLLVFTILDGPMGS
jgi:hypothetical protein